MAICLATRQPTGRYSWVCVCEEREGEREGRSDREQARRGWGWGVEDRQNRRREERVRDRAAPGTHFIMSMSALYPFSHLPELMSQYWGVCVCVCETRITTLTNASFMN